MSMARRQRKLKRSRGCPAAAVAACATAACALALWLATAGSALAVATPPSVDEAYTSGVSAEAATLNAEIDPHGAGTTYRIEYGTTTAYGESVPAGEASVGSGTGDVLVSQHIAGLTAGTVYHYRVLAKSEDGETVGSDQTFVFQSAVPSGQGCTNASLRTGYAVRLPDCRAYEQVTPPQLEPYLQTVGSPGNLVGTGIRALGESAGTEASVGGERLLFFSPYGFPGQGGGGFFFLASRGPDGWSTEDPVPPQSATNNEAGCTNAYFPLVTPELTNWVFADGYGQGERKEGFQAIKEDGCPTDEPALVEGEPQGFQNLFLHDLGAGVEASSWRLIDTPQGAPEGASVNDAWAQGASEDLSRVVFTEAARLTPDAPAITPPLPQPLSAEEQREEHWSDDSSEDLYVWSAGVVRLVTVLPDGSAVAGTLANGNAPHVVYVAPGSATWTHAISSDAGRVAFEAEGSLYVRENPQQPPQEECATPASACTVQLDASQGGTGFGGGHFEWASSDGARVFFTDERDLLAGAHASAGRPDLYEYDFERGEGERLEDVTAGAQAADVLGVSGASEDGSTVYFVADAPLTGAQANSQGAIAQAGEPNLYARRDGTTTFIATLGSSDLDDWVSPPEEMTARVSPDGGFIAFDSLGQLTGYDNRGPCVGSTAPLAIGACQEIFLYDAEDDALSCASCAPSGELPGGPARIDRPMRTDGTLNEPAVTYPKRFVSDSGQVFFNTVAHLLPSDTNGLSNVYEYEEGQLHLLSPGSTSANAYFVEASANGDDVFLVTSELLADTNGDVSVFDARVNGGFPEALAPSACGEGDCAIAAQAPTLSTPASATFSGPGNRVAPKAEVLAEKKALAPQPKTLTRSQKLAKALKACRTKRDKRRRVSCEAHARRLYGPTSKAKTAGESRKGEL
jgi:hypothetical protein